MRKFKDFERIANILSVNGVDYVELFYKSSIAINHIASGNPEIEEELVLSFSDGKMYLGSLQTNEDNVLLGIDACPPIDNGERACVLMRFAIRSTLFLGATPRLFNVKLNYPSEFGQYRGKCVIFPQD